MSPGFISESEAEFMRNKPQKMNKFQEVFDFYHETVPKEQPVAKEEPINEHVENPTDALDPPAAENPAPAETEQS